jgi:hypothetical protein
MSSSSIEGWKKCVCTRTITVVGKQSVTFPRLGAVGVADAIALFFIYIFVVITMQKKIVVVFIVF